MAIPVAMVGLIVALLNGFGLASPIYALALVAVWILLAAALEELIEYGSHR